MRRICILLALWSAGAWAVPPPTEYQVKAAYLFNFGQFVEWPARAYESPGAPFVIGILGDDPFGGALDEVVRGETFGSRPLEVKRFKAPQEIGACNILFI